MTISKRVQKELYSAAPEGVLPPLAVVTAQQAPVATNKRGKRSAAVARGPTKSTSERARTAALAAESKGRAWTDAEHARFLEALIEFPSGPWKAIADFVGTKNSRQTMTHAQKYRQKHERRERGLRNRTKHRRAALTRTTTTTNTTTAATATTTQSTARATATTRSQTNPAHRTVSYFAPPSPMTDSDNDSDSCSDSATSCASESPRSGEESTCNAAAAAGRTSTNAFDVAADAVATSWEQLKVSSLSEMFQDFEPMSFSMWSTTSLGDMDTLVGAAAMPFVDSSAHNELFSDTAGSSAFAGLNPLFG